MTRPKLSAGIVACAVLLGTSAAARAGDLPAPRTTELGPEAPAGSRSREDRPAVTAYLPSPAAATGAGIMVFPGGGFTRRCEDHEGVLVDLIQSARKDADAIIINPAAYSFTSIAIFDAMKIFEGPIFEVHISNIHARDELHRHSKLSAAVKAVIAGLGPYGYIVAMQAALKTLGKLPDGMPSAMRGICFTPPSRPDSSTPDGRRPA